MSRLWQNVVDVTEPPPTPVDAYCTVALYGVAWYCTACRAISLSYYEYSQSGNFVIPLRFVTGLKDLLDPHIGTLGMDSFLAFLSTEFLPQDLIFWREVQELKVVSPPPMPPPNADALFLRRRCTRKGSRSRRRRADAQPHAKLGTGCVALQVVREVPDACGWLRV